MNREPDRATNPEEIEITPEMIEAGVSLLCAFDTTFENENIWAERIFRGMWAAKTRTEGAQLVEGRLS